jgi:hypothetical protein
MPILLRFDIFEVTHNTFLPGKVNWELVFRQKMPAIFAKNEWSTNQANKFSKLNQLESLRFACFNNKNE